MNQFTIAYAIGYFYGRAFPQNQEVELPVQDMYHRDSVGFKAGLDAGRKDFEDIDLPLAALCCKNTD